MAESWLPGSTKLHFLPGDEVKASVLEAAEYKEFCSAAMKKTPTFIRSNEFVSPSFKACLSPIPRWRFTRQLYFDNERQRSNKEDDGDVSDEEFEFVSIPSDLRGVARAHRAFLDETRMILKGRDGLSGYFLNRELQHDTLRFQVWRCMIAPCLYLSERNLPYTGRLYLFAGLIRWVWRFALLTMREGAHPPNVSIPRETRYAQENHKK